MAKKPVLSDHARRGKVLVPPLIHQLGTLQDISWVKTVLPELLWIALVQDKCGTARGVKLITEMARHARQLAQSEEFNIFGSASEYRRLAGETQLQIQQELARTGHLFEIQNSLRPLVALYPNCPLSFLFPLPSDPLENDIDIIKSIVRMLYDRTHRDVVLVQATFIWLAFDSGKLKVADGLALAQFPEIERYPYTDLSQKIAASIRATINFIFGSGQRHLASMWPNYFWNRGLEIDPCYFEV